MAQQRSTDYENLNPMFIDRWSPRAFSPDPLSKEEIETLFEAARWAPSCFNEQPWVFLYAQKEEDLKKFRSILAEKNRVWANGAPVLAFILARRAFRHNGKPNRWAQFDAGSAWMSLALQAHSMGLVVHAMGGFDEQKVYDLLSVPREDYVAMAAVAIGGNGSSDLLPDELREREVPSQRVPLAEVLKEGSFTD